MIEQPVGAHNELGQQLSAFRQAAGYSQGSLAAAVGYSRSSIANIEAGRQQADERFWRKCDEVLSADGQLVASWNRVEEFQRQALRQKAELANHTQRQHLSTLTTLTTGATNGAGIVKFYDDFVDIENAWDALFSTSFTLDLAIMYGATWRNTYRKHLRSLTERPDGRIRVVLPDPSADSPLVPLYANILKISPADFQRKVTEAISDFQTIGPRRHVEVYLTTAVFRHAIYLFTHQAILGLYALSAERIPTPAFLVSEGGLLSFMRVDFDQLLERARRID